MENYIRASHRNPKEIAAGMHQGNIDILDALELAGIVEAQSQQYHRDRVKRYNERFEYETARFRAHNRGNWCRKCNHVRCATCTCTHNIEE